MFWHKEFMSLKNMEISKETSTIMKGYAIAMIALHNFLHLERFGFAPQNENSFSLERTNLFFGHIRDFSFSSIGDFFSFIGWIGVPVFVFMSGYGLEKKYSGKGKIRFAPYLKHSWTKLFLLMLPGVLTFIAYAMIVGKWKWALSSVFSLTLLNNFVCNIIPFNPGVYWYFGLTFQFYVVYYFLHNLPNENGKRFACVSGVFCLIVLMVFNPFWFSEQQAFELIRHNFIGWMPWFAMGVILAKIEKNIHAVHLRKRTYLLLSILLLLVALLMNLNFFVWLFLPFVAIAFFYCFSVVAESWKPTKWLGNWLGSYSSFIFVVHPIARSVVLDLPFNMTLIVQLVVYLVLFVVGAMLYKPLYLKLMSIFHC